MSPIKFFHKDTPDVIHELNGNIVTWGGEQHNRTNSFSETAIRKNFAKGVWIPVQDQLEGDSNAEVVEVLTAEPSNEIQAGAIPSDGGSSSYYDIRLPQWLVRSIAERQEAGEAYVKTEELIEVVFKSDFNFGTAFKSLVRGFGVTRGAGKAGNNLGYEMNKVRYYADRIEEVAGRLN